MLRPEVHNAVKVLGQDTVLKPGGRIPLVLLNMLFPSTGLEDHNINTKCRSYGIKSTMAFKFVPDLSLELQT